MISVSIALKKQVLPAALGVLVIAGCGGDVSDETQIVELSSRDTVVLENPDSAPFVQLVDPLTLRSTSDSRGVLFEVMGATRLPDGRIVVASGGTAALLVYDGAGSLIRVVGREGDGPGEFRRLQRIWWVSGDTIATFDRREQRVSIFADSPLTLLRDFRLETPEGGSFVTLPVGTFADGSLLAWTQSYGPDYVEHEGVNRIDHLVFRASPDGSVATLLDTLPGRQLWLGPSQSAPLAVYGEAPFSPRTMYGLAGGSFFVFMSADFGFTERKPDGGIERLYRREHEAVPITPERKGRHLEEWVRAFGDNEEIWERRRQLRADVSYPDVMPAYRWASTDRVGRAWLEPYAWWDSHRRRLVAYDVSGRAVGRMELPYGASILEIGDGWVLTLEEESDGAEIVRSRQWDEGRK